MEAMGMRNNQAPAAAAAVLELVIEGLANAPAAMVKIGFLNCATAWMALPPGGGAAAVEGAPVAAAARTTLVGSFCVGVVSMAVGVRLMGANGGEPRPRRPTTWAEAIMLSLSLASCAVAAGFLGTATGWLG